jgi:hypothetical protein
MDIRYETLVQNPVSLAKKIYKFCGLDWSYKIENFIIENAKFSSNIASKWNRHITEEELYKITQVMHGSPLNSWWD